MSESFVILQGNRQGTFLSPDDYLSYIMKNLQNLSQTELGSHIGNTNISTPTCTGDMLIITTSADKLQVLLSLITDYANTEHLYIIYPEKSITSEFRLQVCDNLYL